MSIKHLLSIHDAAHILNLTQRKVSDLLRRGAIPHIILPNGQVRFDEDDLWAWAKSFKRPANTPVAELPTRRGGVAMSNNPSTASPTFRSIESDESIPRLALRPREAAVALGISERLLWSKTNAGEIPHCRLGRSVLYPVDSLKEFLAKKTNGGDTQ